ncbi:SH3 and Ded_cyto domain-containing protein [Histoplasma capsulatum]|uniref:SH3 and Ded_cyto domain-containing protein n=1 Tax=Ajellomyces capsulatus TaxID=5037 RepID=A0A8A1MPS0_AJECA|nr:SH3 and Ded_cyto domain-containing protein [Histoplasma capsulatum]
MPWRPLPRIAFAVAIYPFQPSSPADLPLELGDELYIIEQGGANGSWYRGYLVAPPSLLAGLTSVKGRTLEARVFSGIFPKNCVEVREVLGDVDGSRDGRLSTQLTPRKYAGSRTSTASPDSFSLTDGRTLATSVGELKASRKISQITIIKLEEKGGSRRSVSPSLPLTPISLGPRDPSAVKPPAPVPMLKIGDETPTSAAEPLRKSARPCEKKLCGISSGEIKC